MGTAENSSWNRIQQGIKDIERLIGQKQNNLAMVKSRQILEYMVKCLGEKALIVEGDLSDSIDQLYEGRWISQSTKDHFHRIRVLGNKAVHDGDDSAYDANEAYHLLSQEILIFANQNNSKKPAPSARQQQRTAAPQASGTTSRPSGSAARPAGNRPPSSGGQRRRPSGGGSRSVSSSTRSRRRTSKRGTDPMDLLKPILILLVIFLLVWGVKSCVSKGDKAKEPSVPETTPEISTEVMSTTAEPETPAPTEANKIYKTSSKLNVRTEPNTTSAKLGSLAVGTIVEYVGDYDAEWTIITFEGKQAYVSTQYLTVEEAPSAESSAAESSAAETSAVQ